MATIKGTNLDDTLYGTTVSDVITGLGGHDTLKGGGGADRLDGGNGIDTAFYTDSSVGVTVNLEQGRGLGGTAEGDTLVNVEHVYGSDHNDSLTGHHGANDLYGLAGNDLLKGGGGADGLDGGAGDDTLKGGGGADYLAGGTGNDTANYGDSTASVFVLLYAGWGMHGDAEGDSLNSIENLVGSPHDDTLWGDAGANVLRGMDGNDTLVGHGGNDILEGGNGNDRLEGSSYFGGGGTDTLIGGPGNDTYVFGWDTRSVGIVIEQPNEGIDAVYSMYDYVLDANVETLVLYEVNAELDGTGNELNNAIYGNSLANTLDGRGGADIMVGHGGNDFYMVDNTADIVVEGAGQGDGDRVLASVSYMLRAGDQVEIMSTADNFGTTAINLTGNGFANTIFGNAGANTLDGGGGADTLVGFGGDDFYFVDNAADAIIDGTGEGTGDRVFATVSYTLGAGDQIEITSTADHGGTGAIDLTGNELANSIFGNAGVNVLNGGVGNDTLTGFAGADFFLFNTPLNAATNLDQVSDFSVADDTIWLENAVFTALVTTGTLAPGAFRIAAAAADADDRIIYNSSTGAVLYDADGSGAGGAVQFATLTASLALANADFVIV